MSERTTGSRLLYGRRLRRAGNLSLRVLKKNARYPRSGLFLRGMGSVYQTATKDRKTPSAKVIFLDSTSGVTKPRPGDVSEKISDY